MLHHQVCTAAPVGIAHRHHSQAQDLWVLFAGNESFDHTADHAMHFRSVINGQLIAIGIQEPKRRGEPNVCAGLSQHPIDDRLLGMIVFG